MVLIREAIRQAESIARQRGRKAADQGRQLEVTCKEAPGEYTKHFFGKSDNTPYLVEQLGTVDVSVYHTRITFKPQAIIPDIDFRGNAGELVTPRDSSD